MNFTAGSEPKLTDCWHGKSSVLYVLLQNLRLQQMRSESVKQEHVFYYEGVKF